MCTNSAILNNLEYYIDELVDCFEEFVKQSMIVISVALGTIILMIMYVVKLLADRAANSRVVTCQRGERDISPLDNIGDTVCAACSEDTDSSIEFQDYPIETISLSSDEGDTEAIEKKHEKDEDPDEKISLDGESDPKLNYLVSTNNTQQLSQFVSRPSFDETVLREIGLSSCSKPCNTSILAIEKPEEKTKNPEPKTKSKTGIYPPDPTSNQSCIAKHHLSTRRPCQKYIAIRTSCCSMCCVDDDRR